MNILRLSTLSLTLAIAVMTLGYANPSFAGKKCTEDPNHPSCKPPADAGNLYTVEGRGAFVFGPVATTLEGQNNTLRAQADAPMTRPHLSYFPVDAATWDNVFIMPPDPADIMGEPCNLFGASGTVTSFTAHAKDKPNHIKGWTVDLSGGVRINFETDLMKTDAGADVNVYLALIGNCEYSGGAEPCEPFLPDPNNGDGISEIPMEVFWIHAKAVKGTPQIEGCHFAHTELIGPSTLVIRAMAPP
ncbi:MAG: hypothetical protein ACYSU5_22860 [Planctomycetota bacterium]|jgi:hypothetical protein